MMTNEIENEDPTLLLTFSHGMVFINPEYDPEDPESVPAFLGFNTEIKYDLFDPDDLKGALEELISMLPSKENVQKYKDALDKDLATR